ncbi:hypothetical protein ACFVY9_00460 [Streptomyces sp. NPDC059544]|uniref:hypothetical protein n=1 Tax=Streptomyces sp. NPDC059544 TaxID=3346861 RepID=UPI0036BC386B
MPRIRVLVSVAGDGFVWEPGQEIDLPGPEAAAWADGHRAELVRSAPLETPESSAAVKEKAARPARRAAPKRG